MRPRKGPQRRPARGPRPGEGPPRRLGKDMGPRRRLGRKGIEAERAPAGGIIEPGTSYRAEAVSGGPRTYHAIVAARVRKLFKRLGLWDYTLVLDKLAAQREHSFYGVARLAARALRMPRSNTETSAGRASCATRKCSAATPPTGSSRHRRYQYAIDRKAG
jgi:hypothetical protein